MASLVGPGTRCRRCATAPPTDINPGPGLCGAWTFAAASRVITRMKGDKVEIVVDAGSATRTYHVEATRAGRRVDVAIRRGVVEVTEVTRNGAPVRTARFMSSRVIALVEHPGGSQGYPEVTPPPPRAA